MSYLIVRYEMLTFHVCHLTINIALRYVYLSGCLFCFNIREWDCTGKLVFFRQLFFTLTCSGAKQLFMRAVIQRVSEASVTVEGKITGIIEKGLLVLLGIEDADSMEDLEWLSAKVVNMRIFNDEQGVMNVSIKDAGGDILLVSQFTLHASTKKGNRPSYSRAAKGDFAIPLYEKMITQLENDLGKKIQTGIFGADMKLALINDGPVTIVMDSKNKE